MSDDEDERMVKEVPLEWLVNYTDLNIDDTCYRKPFKFYRLSPKLSKVLLNKDRAVQTEPELNISPSWMIATEKELCKLHTKVANIINILHDMPDYYFNREIEVTGTDQAFRPFTYGNENSPTMTYPAVKYPGCTNFKRFAYELKDLLKVTSRLRDDFPYVAEQRSDSLTLVDEGEHSYRKIYEIANKSGRIDAKPFTVGSTSVSKPYGGVTSCSSDAETSCFDTLKPCCSSCTPSCCKQLIFDTKHRYYLTPFRRALRDFNQEASSSPNSSSKFVKASQTKFLKKDPPKILLNKENQSSTKAGSGYRKNFIKRNILAVKSSVVSSKRMR